MSGELIKIKKGILPGFVSIVDNIISGKNNNHLEIMLTDLESINCSLSETIIEGHIVFNIKDECLSKYGLGNSRSLLSPKTRPMNDVLLKAQFSSSKRNEYNSQIKAVVDLIKGKLDQRYEVNNNAFGGKPLTKGTSWIRIQTNLKN